MKKFLLSGLIILAVNFLLFAQSGPVISIVNDTEYPIYYIYISDANTNDWEEDILGEDVLMPGHIYNVRLPHNGLWDFLAIDVDGDEYILMGISVSDADRIVLTN